MKPNYRFIRKLCGKRPQRLGRALAAAPILAAVFAAILILPASAARPEKQANRYKDEIAAKIEAETPSADKNMPAAAAFGALKTPSKGAAEPVGFYSKGCLAGAEALPMTAKHWQILHPSRNRNWGDPGMIAYLRDLAAKAAQHGWRGLLIGDIAQPRGGPLLFGHASHQSGLDADIWFAAMPKRGLSLAERENIKGGSVLRADSSELDPKKWSKAHTALLRLAAENPQTDRIFVSPGIKKYLCQNAAGDTEWLGKIRPYWGHKEHFHVRLKCPQGAKNCEAQAPVPKGSGCDSSLDWWFTPSATLPKKPAWSSKSHKPKIMTIADMPKQCQSLLP